MESEDITILRWAVEDAVKKWHKERPGDRTYGGTSKDRKQATHSFVRRIIYGPPKPGCKK